MFLVEMDEYIEWMDECYDWLYLFLPKLILFYYDKKGEKKFRYVCILFSKKGKVIKRRKSN